MGSVFHFYRSPPLLFMLRNVQLRMARARIDSSQIPECHFKLDRKTNGKLEDDETVV